MKAVAFETMKHGNREVRGSILGRVKVRKPSSPRVYRSCLFESSYAEDGRIFISSDLRLQ
ncbi:hypothetical protein HOLleu_25435 [Holothuria leucospilota]|uniref:Uncharacterized protein n=1 Tax=Holothuria leucospilota TaxID=206669 RepID=A0A9Q1BSU6_HOLLE|nr:hypothetical protein HOLleu_25435 [Holothuria leucospilota]